MASLSVRRIDDRVFEKLRVRAAEHGVSMEERSGRSSTARSPRRSAWGSWQCAASDPRTGSSSICRSGRRTSPWTSPSDPARHQRGV